MKVLAIDTSANVATAAVMEEGVLLGEYILNHKKTHSQKIMVMIEELLGDLELTVRDIDLFAVANGPGSFTGLRIGVATMKALAHSVNKPIVGISPLAGMAYNLPYAEHIIVPVMDARANRIYTASYIWDEGFKELTEPEATTIEECIANCGELLDTVFVGDGAVRHMEYIKEKLGDKAIFAPATAMNQRASSIAALALDMAKRGEVSNYADLKPVYLKKSQAEQELEERQKGDKV